MDGKNRTGKKRGKVSGRVCGESIETDRQQKKELMLRLTKGNHADFSGILVTRAKYFILTLLAHPGNQELFLGKLAVKPFDFAAAGHADMPLHLRDSIGKEQVSGSWLDAGRIWDGELVAHGVTFLGLTSFRYPHVLQLAFCEWSA
ncbi:MAG: hypothetical protein KJ729_01945 [Euryarchaeota archaeon]|nr:hypothetical protein [Euryarchaeota archaeon]